MPLHVDANENVNEDEDVNEFEYETQRIDRLSIDDMQHGKWSYMKTRLWRLNLLMWIMCRLRA